MVSGIYSITNKINGKKYVGQALDISHRFSQHKSALRSDMHSNNHLQHSWNKYGEENFLFEIITECSIDELDELETYYIHVNNSMHPFGYNIESGGNKNKIVSEETRHKISKSLSGRRHPLYGKFKEESPLYGRKHTEITKKKISEALKGEKNYNYGKQLPLNVKKKISINKNTSSYFRVSKIKDNRYKQGFIWQYTYYENNKRKKIRSVDIKKLEDKVTSKGLEWFELSKSNTIQKLSYNEKSKFKRNPTEYAYVIVCGFTKKGKQKYCIKYKNEIIKKSTFPERLQIICAKINHNIEIPKELFILPKQNIPKEKPRIVKLGLNSSGNQKYGVSYCGKIIKGSTSVDKLQKICDKIISEGIDSYYDEENYKKTHAYIRKENLSNGKEQYAIIFKGKVIKRSIYKDNLEKLCNEINSKGINWFYNEYEAKKNNAYIIKDGTTRQGKQQYCIMQNGKKIKASIFKEKLEKICQDINNNQNE